MSRKACHIDWSLDGFAKSLAFEKETFFFNEVEEGS
jgi:hypothetical protein